MNARGLAVLLGCAALAWALLLLRPAARTSSPDAAHPAPGSTPQPAKPASGARPADPRAAAQSPATAAIDESAREWHKRLAVEQDRRHDRRFDAAVARWKDEPRSKRQEPWASERERALRGALNRDGLGRLAQRIECRATLCRLQLAAADTDFTHVLRSAAQLRRELGGESASALGGEGDARALILFVPRRGMRLDTPPLTSPPAE